MPYEILLMIFLTLKKEDLINAMFICQYWYRVSNDDLIWRSLYKESLLKKGYSLAPLNIDKLDNVKSLTKKFIAITKQKREHKKKIDNINSELAKKKELLPDEAISNFVSSENQYSTMPIVPMFSAACASSSGKNTPLYTEVLNLPLRFSIFMKQKKANKLLKRLNKLNEKHIPGSQIPEIKKDNTPNNFK